MLLSVCLSVCLSVSVCLYTASDATDAMCRPAERDVEHEDGLQVILFDFTE